MFFFRCIEKSKCTSKFVEHLHFFSNMAGLTSQMTYSFSIPKFLADFFEFVQDRITRLFYN